MRVRIRRVPQTQVLEGIDLRPFVFHEGRLYDVDPPVARVLLSWGYAERHPKVVAPPAAEARACSKCGSRQTTVMGQSQEPPLIHLSCGSCGFISVHPLA
jgi:ribosomal protein S27AE